MEGFKDENNANFLAEVASTFKETESEESCQTLLNIMVDYTTMFMNRLHSSGFESGKLQKGNMKTNRRLSDIIKIGDDKHNPAEILDVFDRDVAQTGINFSKPTTFAYMPGSGHMLFAMGDFLAGLTHTMSIGRFVNEGACEIEESVVKWVAEIIGYPEEARGVTVSGTSMGCVMALATAREHCQITDVNKAVVYMTEHAHLCHIRGLRIVGLGACVQRCVPSNKNRMDAAALESMVKEDKQRGLTPFLVVASAGATGMGAIDPFSPVADIARVHNIWFHVDASYGGMLLLDDTVKERCQGIDLCDSITVDITKGISATWGSSVLLVREGSRLRKTMTPGTSPYILQGGQEPEYSPVDYTIEFSRPFRAFPVWFTLKVLGCGTVKSLITEKIRLAQYAYDALCRMDLVSVYMKPDLTIIAFRFAASGKTVGNIATQRCFELLSQEGEISVSTTTAEGYLYIRLCILSIRTHIEHMEKALTSIKKALLGLEFLNTKSRSTPIRQPVFM